MAGKQPTISAVKSSLKITPHFPFGLFTRKMLLYTGWESFAIKIIILQDIRHLKILALFSNLLSVLTEDAVHK
jgi:hypothetical protein